MASVDEIVIATENAAMATTIALDRTTSVASSPIVTARIMCTDLAGLRAQALGLAELAGFAADHRVIRPKPPWNHLSPMLWPDPRCAIDKAAFDPPDGDLLIGAGGAAARVMAALRRPDLPAVIVQHPRMDPDRFDLIVAAKHDGISGPNVVIARTALHGVTPARLAQAGEIWAPAFGQLRRPLVAVLVGGSNGRYRLDTAAARALARDLASMITRDRASVMLTPSRRTEPAARAVLRDTLAPLGAFVWDMMGENPYLGMLALADAIIVTADSVSMVSEAVATSAPVLLARLPGKSSRIGSFMNDMIALGRARNFAGRFDHWPVAPLNDTPMAAAELRRRLAL